MISVFTEKTEVCFEVGPAEYADKVCECGENDEAGDGGVGFIYGG